MNIGGKKVNGWYVVGGVAGVGVVLYIWKKNTANAGSSSAASGTGVDPVTGMPYSQDNTVDPLTGMTYLQEAQQYGSVSAAESASASAGTSYFGASGGGGYGGTAGYPTFYGNSTQAATSYATNAQWAQAVTSGLTALGYSSTDVSAALGLYFQDMPLGTAPDGVSYTSIVQAAVAEFGPPPVGSFSIVSSGSGSNSGGGSGSGGTGASQVAVPAVIGMTAGLAHNAIVSAGLVPVDSDWTSGDASRIVTNQSPASGTQVASGSKVSYTVAAASTTGSSSGGSGSSSGSTSGSSTPGSGFKGDTGVTTRGPVRGYGGAGPNVPGSIKTTTGGQVIYYPAGTTFTGPGFSNIPDFKVLGVVGQGIPVGS